ncbi:MAG: hypothetical protein N4A37_03265 [Prolixibacteraceae bacterium]|jgi:DNA-binding Lrp family transcriptional regulator|nr:hypothetical protein [Prolixibacteraceae bacterium]
MKDSVIPITLIEYAYRHRALDILQLYWLLQDKEFLIDQTTKKQLVKKLKISETTLSRRIVKLKRLHFIQRSAKENYYQITPPSHILSKKSSKEKANYYRIKDIVSMTLKLSLSQPCYTNKLLSEKYNSENQKNFQNIVNVITQKTKSNVGYYENMPLKYP